MSCLRKGGRQVIVGLYGGALNIPLPFIPMNARIIQDRIVLRSTDCFATNIN